MDRSEIMRRIKSRNTTPERAVRAALRRLGVRSRSRKLAGTPDFVLPDLRAALFVHGCYWHRHACRKGRSHPTENRDFWRAKFARNVERDKRVARMLRRQGWRVLTVWECQIKSPESLDGLLARKLGL